MQPASGGFCGSSRYLIKQPHLKHIEKPIGNNKRLYYNRISGSFSMSPKGTLASPLAKALWKSISL